MSEDHERRIEAAERELAELEERSERVGEQIDATRKDWDAKVADPSVPGAGGDPDDDGIDDTPKGAGNDMPPPDPNETD